MDEEKGFFNLDIWKQIGAEYTNAVEKHGPKFSTPQVAVHVLFAEVMRAAEAAAKGNINGPNGFYKKIAQAASTCIKALESLK